MPSKIKSEELPGFPVEFVFQSKEELDEYFSGERVQCLRCGRWLMKLGNHLKACHAMTCDEYRGIYGIPWRRGLVCATTRERYSQHAYRMIAEGVVTLTDENRCKIIGVKHRPHQQSSINELKKRTKARLLRLGYDGTQAKWRRANTSPKGSAEYKEKMRNRPQVGCPEFTGWWKGKTQSPEHIRKRMDSSAKTRMQAKEPTS